MTVNKKATLILFYVGVWALMISEHLYIGVFSHYKSRFATGSIMLILMVLLPYILFRILTAFGVEKNNKWYSITITAFLFMIVYMMWTSKIDAQRLNNDGQETTGVVYEAWTSRRKHLVRIKYTVGWEDFTTFSDTDHKKVLSVGDTVTIIYWRGNPDLYKIKEFWK